jgi:hypothetical protein
MFNNEFSVSNLNKVTVKHWRILKNMGRDYLGK